MGNFAKTFLTGTHTLSDTTLNVTAGTGTRFTANKYATVWKFNAYTDAAEAYHAGKAEVVLIGTVGANSITGCTRGQLGTSAIDLNESGAVYQLFEGVYTTQIIPLQTGNSGKYLTTDGSTPSWGTISTTSTVPLAFFNIGANLNPGSTAYAAPGAWVITQSTDVYQMTLPACEVVGIYAGCDVNGISGSTVFTVRKDLSDTAFTATIAQGATTGSNLVSTAISYTSGQKLSVKIVTASGGAAMQKLYFTILLRFTA